MSRFFTVALGFILGACAPSNPTQLVVVVDSDVAALDEVEIVVSGLGGGDQAAFARLADGALPRWVVLERRGGALGPIEVAAHARVEGARIGVSSAARTSFVRGQTRRLDLFLAAACATETCGADESCGQSGCRALDVASETLPPWVEPGVDGGGLDGGGDDGGACSCPTTLPVNTVATRCEGGRCVAVCADGYADCDGVLTSDNGCEQSLSVATNCGGCGERCEAPTEQELVRECRAQNCVLECRPDFGDCNTDASDGCETSLATDENCGECGRRCDNGASDRCDVPSRSCRNG